MENLIIKNREQFGQTLDSLQKAISDAGGSPWLADLFNMTVLEFLTTIASNNYIRFYHSQSFSLSKTEPVKKIIPTGLRGNVE